MKRSFFSSGLKGLLLPFFLFSAIATYSHPAVCLGSCEYLSEDFSSGGSGWKSYDNATWSVPSGTLDVQAVDSGNLARADVAFSPSDMFSVDVDINILSTSSDNDAVGIYFWTNADVLFSVAGYTTDGVAVLYYPASKRVRFLIWDVLAGEWVFPMDAYSVSMAVDSIGLSMVSDGVILRLNGQDTNMEIAGDFSFGPVVIDTLSLLAHGTGLHARFDNVCASMHGAPSGSGMLMPGTAEVMPFKAAASAPVVSTDAAQSVPLGFGSAATGGGTFSLSAGISGLGAPADLYIGVQSAVLGPEIYLFDANNTLHAFSSAGLVKWRSSSTGNIQTQVLPSFATSALPAGTYNFYFLMAPAGGSLNVYRLWMTQLTVAGSTVTDKQMEADIRSNLDLILGATSGLSGGLTQITQLFSDNNVVTTSPANLDLNALLSGVPITITANFGSGYRTADGSILTGSGQIVLSNISFGSQGIGGDLSATFTNITKDGAPLLNGGISGSVKLTQTTENSGDISGYVTFNGLEFSGKSQSGTVQISGTVANLNVNSLSGTGMVRLTFSNFVSGAYAVNSGTADISLNSTGGITVATNLQTSEGLINLSLRMTEGVNNAQVINTLSPGSAGQYTVSIQNVTLDDDVCEKYPASGTMTFTKNGTTGVVTFTGACDGSYQYSEQ